MEVQRRDLAVRAGVGEVDRVPVALVAQRLAGIEVPAEETVDGQRHVLEHRAVPGVEEIVIHAVAVVQRRAGVIVDAARLRAEPDAAHEVIVGQDALLQVHHLRAALLVGAAQRFLVVDLVDADPGAAVVGFHEQRVADLVADFAEVEVARVLAQRRLQVGAVVVSFGRNHPGVGDRQAEAHHRAIAGLLFVGLQRPRVVVDIEVVQDDRFLDPFAAGLVPVGQAVDDDVVLDRLAQVERFDRGAFDLETDFLAVVRNRQVEPAHQGLVTDRPADVGTERQPDVPGCLLHAFSSGCLLFGCRSLPASRTGVPTGRRLVYSVWSA